MQNDVIPKLRKISESSSRSKSRDDYEDNVGFNGAQTVIEGPFGAPIVPAVGGSPQALLDLNAGAANLLIGFRATAGAGDDVVASERLASGSPGVAQSGADSVVSFNLSAPVTRLDVVGIMNNAGVASGGCIDHAGTAANALAQMTQFDFSTPVSRIVISMTPTFASGQEGQISVEGYSNA